MPEVTGLPAPRVFATDLDGTLLRSDGTVSDRTRAAFHSAWDAGLDTVIVTARPPRWVDHLADLAGEHGIIYCANGAYTYDPHRRRVTENFGFTPDELTALVTDLRALPGTTLGAELPSGFWHEENYPSEPPADQAGDRTGTISDLLTIPEVTGKLLARSSELNPDAFHARVREIVGKRAVLQVSCTDGLAELSPPGVSKADALSRFVRARGLAPADVWAFGDMPNDIPMLTWAGAGFAVGNASADVRAAADAITYSNDEDGVAAVIERALARSAA